MVVMEKTYIPRLPFAFEPTRLYKLESIQRAAYSKVIHSAQMVHPKVICQNAQDLYFIDGCPVSWVEGGFKTFQAEVKRKVPTQYHEYARINNLLPWSCGNIKVQLTPIARKRVCEAIREELQKSQDLDVVLNELVKKSVPSENAKTFTSFTLSVFIKADENRHLIYPPVRKDNLAGLKI
jgi:hypothetical protein